MENDKYVVFMQRELPGPARSILDALLDQFEQPGRQRVVRVRLNEVQHYDYFHADDVAVRRDANELLQRLAEQGSLRLHWRRWEEGNWLDKVDLIAEGAVAIYQHAMSRRRCCASYWLRNHRMC
jgi:hypothetical protein